MATGFYSFLPYLRQGFSSRLSNADNYDGSTNPLTGNRASINLHINLIKTLVDGGIIDPSVNKTVDLKGPGDVKGINSNAIVKISPANWVTNFEPNYLPYIEFYDEDFCWRYTPAMAKTEGAASLNRFRLRPWITLVVLKETEFTNDTPFNGILPSITLSRNTTEVFPKQSDLWAWAHVHVNENIARDDNAIGTPAGGSVSEALVKLKGILQQDGDKAVSRLISPRRLEPNTGYYAFLIPTFEAGRLTGLGRDIPSSLNMTDPAWSSTNADWQFPVYHQWFFKTGAAGDFESLVRLLQPKILSQEVGKREVDLQKSNNFALEQASLPGGDPTINLRGVVQPADASAESWDLQSDYANTIRSIINGPSALIDQVGGDPLIAPPIYGRWHALEEKVEQPAPLPAEPDWLQESNLDPRYRLFAGVGTETIRRNQEKYMEVAWDQIGEVLEANRRLRQLQLTRQANLALYEKHLTPLNEELLINISSPIHQRIKNSGNQFTVYKEVDESAIPVTMLSGAFRRISRPGGPLVQGIAMDTGTLVSTTQLIAAVNNGNVQPAGPYLAPAGQLGYTIWAPAQLTPSFTLSLSPNAGFQFANPGVITGTPVVGPNAPATQLFVNSVVALHSVIATLPSYSFVVNPGLLLPDTKQIILKRTEPYANSLNLATQFLSVTSVEGAAIAIQNLNQVMAAPKIKTPMYEELAKISPDWIMPGLNDIEANSINILETNQKYIEAYMLGLNYEMGRELLWRGYPTDQRGTCFSFFWGYNNSMSLLQQPAANIFDLNNYRDIKDIHEWGNIPVSRSKLGANNARTAMAGLSSLLILTIRGELLRKYPGTIIYLQRSRWKMSGSVPVFTEAREEDPNYAPVYPVFTGKIEPDIYLLGFTKSAEEVRGGVQNVNDPGYFVVFQERAGEVRFGADEFDPNNPGYSTNINSWHDVNWWNIKDNPASDGFPDLSKSINVTGINENPDSVTWNANAATIAYALHQSPVKLDVHAYGLIPG